MKKNSSYESCVLLAINQFNTYYNHLIKDLLNIFPVDAKDKEGQPFWSGPKRAPSPIDFDVSNKHHITFVQCYANLIAAALNMPQVSDQAKVAEIAKACKP
jgi:ubiquitin-activating enzyme E1